MPHEGFFWGITGLKKLKRVEFERDRGFPGQYGCYDDGVQLPFGTVKLQRACQQALDRRWGKILESKDGIAAEEDSEPFVGGGRSKYRVCEGVGPSRLEELVDL